MTLLSYGYAQQRTGEEVSGKPMMLYFHFDRVLVDAPCSGEGMFRKEPQAVRQHSQALVQRCAALGAQILDAAAAALRPGGRLVYSTCTVAPQENQAAVRAFLAGHPGFRLRPAGCAIPGALEEDGMATLLPFFTQTDGFFIASLERLW